MIGAVFRDMQIYVGFTDEDSARLRALLPLIEPRLSGVIDLFYDAILRSPGARAVLQDEAQVERLKKTLVVWLRELFAGPHDDAYFERRVRIGYTHVRVGLAIQYMVTAIDVVRRATTAALTEDGLADPAALDAVHKVLDLDLAIMLQTYAGIREDAARVGGREEMVEQYADIFDSARAVIMQIDGTGRILAANREAERLCGIPREEIVGTALLPYVHPDDRALMQTVIAAAAAEGAASMLQCRCVFPGRDRHVDWTLAHMGGPDGPRRVLVGIDVTERVLLAERARSAERLATIGKMSAVLAHEIRNPLNAATLQLTLLQRLIRADSTPGGQRAAQAATIVQSEIKRLEALVTEFLGFARPTNLDRAPIAVRELLADVLPLVAEVARAQQARFELDVPSDVPMVDVDRMRMGQVLLNLLNNALDAMPDHGGTITLRAVREADRSVRIEILDEGKGIAPSDLARVFEPFFTTKAKGTGLGLAVVRRIVEDHGGTVTLQNRAAPSEGAAAAIVLPAAGAGADAAGAA
jgi:PAS domain S-box-containing protein